MILGGLGAAFLLELYIQNPFHYLCRFLGNNQMLFQLKMMEFQTFAVSERACLQTYEDFT